MPSDGPSIYCIDCGYPLNHLPNPRCPECGRDFDPDDSKTFLYVTLEQYKHRKRVAGLGMFLLVFCCLAIGFPLCVPPLAVTCERAPIDIAKSDVGRAGNISKQLELYKYDMGRFPTTAEGLAALFQAKDDVDDPRYNGPYLDGAIKDLVDPWGNPYEYRQPGLVRPDQFDLWSWGPNGKDEYGLEDSDDIKNWVDP